MRIIAVAIAGLMFAAQAEALPWLGSLTEELRAPTRLAVAADGTVLVSDALNRHIARFDASGVLLGTWSVPQRPIGVAVHPDGRVFVSLGDVPKVAAYDSDFNFLFFLGEQEPSVSFAAPTDIDIADDTGRIYVTDAEGDKVYGFESDGSIALILGVRGSWPGQFVYPSAIAVDEARNRLIVADHDKWRVQTFTTSGVFLQQFGDRLTSSGGATEGWMPRPLGLAVDVDGSVFVTDALMSTVRTFDVTGSETGKILEYGAEPGGLFGPSDIALSHDGSRLYVVNTGYSRVDIYDATNAGLTAGDGGVASAAGTLQGDAGGLDMGPGGGGVGQVAVESTWNGPHLVDARPDLCGACHGNKRQPGSHPGTIEGQTALCLSCHNAGGRALQAFIRPDDLADPFGTNDAAVDGQGRSHAWGVLAENLSADSIGPQPGSPMAQYLDQGDTIKCSTCHNQHNTDYGPSYLRVSNEADAMCKECHVPRDVGPGEGGSHPVGFLYPESTGEYPAGGDVSPLVIKDGQVECLTCHAVHGADSGGAHGGDGDGMLLRDANDDSLCRKCHTEHAIHAVSGDWQPTCTDCHGIHDVGNTNVALVASEIEGIAVSFSDSSVACGDRPDFVHRPCAPASYDGICEVCHTTTEFHRNNADGDHAHNVDQLCTNCHLHNSGFMPTGAPCASCHGEPPNGTESPNLAGSHAVHFDDPSGPSITECGVCHRAADAQTHYNGVVSFVTGFDADLDGDISLAETDVCDECHSDGGVFDGVNDPVIGAKANWALGVYDDDALKLDKQNWCLGCHDDAPAIVNGVSAPFVSGDDSTWGYNVAGHGRHCVTCTECHDRALPHVDGEAKTFSLRFPLSDGTIPDPAVREEDREAYNDGFRLRRIDGQRALEVPRDSSEHDAGDFALCFSCHDELKLLGVPANYGTIVGMSAVPEHLRLPAGVAQTNYRNEYEWGFGFGWTGASANVHWDHIGTSMWDWDVDKLPLAGDSRRSCGTCHNPHGERLPSGEPTIAMTTADLGISYGVYNDGVQDRDYGYVGSGAYQEAGGCRTCHPFFGPGLDPPFYGNQTRYYRQPLDLIDDCRIQPQTFDSTRGEKLIREVGIERGGPSK